MNETAKPVCQLTGQDGNAFAVIGRVTSALKKVGLRDVAQEFSKKALQCGSYDELLQLCMMYVDAR